MLLYKKDKRKVGFLDMNFFDIKPSSLPEGAQYFFNILVITIAVTPEIWEELIGNLSIQHIWYAEDLTAPEPQAICLYQEEEMEEDCDFEIAMYPHRVVELYNNDIAWYDMIDFDTDDPWRLDGEVEE